MSKILYHYTSGNGLFGIINSSQLHCSHISFLNDPSEHKYFDTILEKLLKTNEDCKNIYEQLYNESYIGITHGFHNYYVLSLSKNEDSLTMWNYYAKGNGYNLGFLFDKILERNKISSSFLVELLYNETQQYQQLKRFIKSFKKDLIKLKNLEGDEYNHSDHFLVEKFNNGLTEMRYTFKHSSYSREEEIRILIAKQLMENHEVHYRISYSGVVVEYITLKLDIQEDLRVVTIHPLGNNIHIDGVERFLKSIKTNEKLRVLKSSIPFRNV